MPWNRTWRTLGTPAVIPVFGLMKKIFLRTAMSMPVLLAVLSAAWSIEVAGQNLPPRDRTVVPTVISRPAKTSDSAAFSKAATANAASVGTLKWPFGGRTQNGWGIYLELIAQTIGAEANAGDEDFASALAVWQTTKERPATGVMDAETMQTFVSFWQSRRLGRSSVPPIDKLVSAPIADFWDPGRDPNMLQLERETYAAYKRMIAAASKDLAKQLRFSTNGELAPGEKFLRIISAFRSPEYQATLRKREPGAGRAALAKHSPHFTGQALDIYVGGEPVTTKDWNRLIQVRTPAYKWLVKNASRFGFYPYFYEPWHWEYVPGR